MKLWSNMEHKKKKTNKLNINSKENHALIHIYCKIYHEHNYIHHRFYNENTNMSCRF